MDVRRVLGKVKKYGFKRSVEKVAQDFLFFPKKYYSGSGEDVMLQYYCPQNTGFYVDVGAYHPKRASVTRMFYRRGWHGINIEPNPNAIKAFKRLRRRDININIGVSDKVGELDYYYWGKSHPGNTFDAELYKKWTEGFGHGPEKIMKIKVDTLNNILANNLPEGTVIDFFDNRR
jgi:FkbM family methyltransferase